MKTFYLNILTAWNCNRRRLDAQKVYDYMIANRFSFTKKYRKADILILSTCAYLKRKEDRSIEFIEYYSKRCKQQSKIIIIGCLPAISPNRLDRLGNFVCIPPREMRRFDEIIRGKIRFDSLPDPIDTKSLVLGEPTWLRFFKEFELHPRFFAQCLRWVNRSVPWLNFSFANRPTYVPYSQKEICSLRIASGCLGNCSYCVIKFATGNLVSRPIEDIVRDFKNGLNKGYKIFQVLGEDVGCYGLDIKTTIVKLLEEIFRIPEDYKLMIKYFNAQWLIKYYDDLERIFSENYKKIDFFNVPIQSGSDKILRLMNRPYRIEELKSCLRRLEQKVPELKLTTHILVGFPGEDEECFEETKEFVKEFRLAYTEVFPYSDHPRAKSFNMANKIPLEIIDRRWKEMKDIVRRLRSEADSARK